MYGQGPHPELNRISDRPQGVRLGGTTVRDTPGRHRARYGHWPVPSGAIPKADVDTHRAMSGSSLRTHGTRARASVICISRAPRHALGTLPAPATLLLLLYGYPFTASAPSWSTKRVTAPADATTSVCRRGGRVPGTTGGPHGTRVVPKVLGVVPRVLGWSPGY